MIDLKRAVAFHINGKDNAEKALEHAKSSMSAVEDKMTVFCPSSFKVPQQLAVDIVVFPHTADNVPKQKNFILKWFKDRDFRGFLHLVESSIVFNSKTKSYMDKLESVMKTLDYDIHLSTITDRCNYVFNKFCPRLSLDIDELQLKFQLDLPDKLCFMSHSNMAYITFNFGALGDAVPMLDERFTVGMFYIIEFLARRRAERKEGQLYYMNQYLSISDEVGAYDCSDCADGDIDQETMQKENELFKSLGINYASDNNIDIVLDALYNKLKAKAA